MASKIKQVRVFFNNQTYNVKSLVDFPKEINISPNKVVIHDTPTKEHIAKISKI